MCASTISRAATARSMASSRRRVSAAPLLMAPGLAFNLADNADQLGCRERRAGFREGRRGCCRDTAATARITICALVSPDFATRRNLRVDARARRATSSTADFGLVVHAGHHQYSARRDAAQYAIGCSVKVAERCRSPLRHAALGPTGQGGSATVTNLADSTTLFDRPRSAKSSLGGKRGFQRRRL